MTEPTYTPADDIYEPYSDGSGLALIAPAGVPMPYTRAVMLGLVPEQWHRYADGVWESGPLLPGETNEEAMARVTATLRGVDVPPGDLAASLASPGSILNDEIRDTQGTVVLRAKGKRHAPDL